MPAVNSVLFYEDEKGPVAAKTHIWWYIMVLFCTIKEGIQQGSKDKRYPERVWYLYDYTNNKMWTHSYKQKTEGKQFLDFIKRADQKYNDINIKQIFLVLDNVSIHKSNNKVKETMAKHHPKEYIYSISSN